MKPMIKYRGGKSKEIPYIIKDIPRFSGRYVEPFFGGGALFFFLEPERGIINDINSKLMDFYRGVRDNYDSLRAELDRIEAIYVENREEFDRLKAENPGERVEDKNERMYYCLRSMFNETAEKTFSDAALYYYINKTAYSGMIRYNANGEFNVPFGRYRNLNTKLVTPAHSRLLRNAEIYNTDYSDIFDMCRSDDFVFLDPPYDCIFSDYGNEEYRDGFDEESHRRLAADFKNLPCKSLMVIGHTSLTDELYRGYIVNEYDKKYAVNIRNRFKAAASHIVVTNYKRREDDSRNRIRFYKDVQYPQLSLFEAEYPYGKNRQ